MAKGFCFAHGFLAYAYAYHFPTAGTFHIELPALLLCPFRIASEPSWAKACTCSPVHKQFSIYIACVRIQALFSSMSTRGLQDGQACYNYITCANMGQQKIWNSKV